MHRSLAAARVARAQTASRHIAAGRSVASLSYSSRARIGPVALGAFGSPSLHLAQSRSLSWTPWKRSQAVVEEGAPVEQAIPVEAAGTSVTPPPLSQAGAVPATPHVPTASADLATTPAVTSATTPAPVATSLPPAADVPDTASLLPQSPASGSTPALHELIAANPGDLPAVLQSPEAVSAVMQMSDLKLMGLDHSIVNPAGWIRDIMTFAHVETGLPWWGTIMLVTVCLRASIVPLVIRVQKNNVRMQAIQPQSTGLMTKLKEANAAGDKAAAQVYGIELTKLWRDNNCNPWKSLILPLVQMPLFMSFFFAVRKMAVLPVPQLKEGGIGWVTDLTIPDPYYILPITSMALTLAVLEIGADGTGGAARTRQMMHFTNFFRVASVFAIPFVGKMPAALLFYWTFSNFITLVQAFVLKQAPVRRLLKIPSPPPAPPPPKGTVIEAPPTLMDTFDAVRDYFGKTHQQALARAKMPKDQQTIGNVYRDVIREAGASSTGRNTAVSTAAAVTPSAATTTASKPVRQASSPVLDAVADAKAQRIAAARERRNRQK